MAKMEEAEKVDFRNGFLVRNLADEAITLGQVAGEDAVLVRRGDEFFCGWRKLHSLPRVAFTGVGRWGHRAMSLASRLFQPAHWRGVARARARPDPALACRKDRRQSICTGETRRLGAKTPAQFGGGTEPSR